MNHKVIATAFATGLMLLIAPLSVSAIQYCQYSGPSYVQPIYGSGAEPCGVPNDSIGYSYPNYAPVYYVQKPYYTLNTPPASYGYSTNTGYGVPQNTYNYGTSNSGYNYNMAPQYSYGQQQGYGTTMPYSYNTGMNYAPAQTYQQPTYSYSYMPQYNYGSGYNYGY